jgi:hypothetical protein
VLKAIGLGELGGPAVRIFEPIVSPAGTSLGQLSELGSACRTTEETEENVGVASSFEKPELVSRGSQSA